MILRRATGAVALAIALTAMAVAMPAASAPTVRAYVLGSRSPLTASEIARLRDAGARVHDVHRNFGGASVGLTDADVARVRALDFVTSVSADQVRQPTAASSTAASPLPGRPYWLDMVDAERNGTFDGSGVWVMGFDSGFYPNWRDYFDPAAILTQYATAFVAVGGSQNVNQWDRGSDPHGMATAATVVGHRLLDDTDEGGWGTGYATGAAGTYWVPGVAPGAKFIPVKVCEPVGCFESAINAAYDYAISLKKANPGQPIVINQSLGGGSLSAVEKAAIDAVNAAGIVLVASAGNEGDAGMGFPAAYEPVVSVGAGGWVDQWDTLPSKLWWLGDVPEGDMSEVYVAGFSSREKQGQHLDVVSTGRYLLLPYPCAQLYKDGQVHDSTNVRTCAGKATPDNASAAPFQYLFMSGTSFSAPTVAGIVALMLDKNGSLSNADALAGSNPPNGSPGRVERLLEQSATPIAPGSATLVHRTGDPLTETWGADATGNGWVFVDDALARA
jgi:Subtilase family